MSGDAHTHYSTLPITHRVLFECQEFEWESLCDLAFPIIRIDIIQVVLKLFRSSTTDSSLVFFLLLFRMFIFIFTFIATNEYQNISSVHPSMCLFLLLLTHPCRSFPYAMNYTFYEVKSTFSKDSKVGYYAFCAH